MRKAVRLLIDRDEVIAQRWHGGRCMERRAVWSVPDWEEWWMPLEAEYELTRDRSLVFAHCDMTLKRSTRNLARWLAL